MSLRVCYADNKKGMTERKGWLGERRKGRVVSLFFLKSINLTWEGWSALYPYCTVSKILFSMNFQFCLPANSGFIANFDCDFFECVFLSFA